MSIHGISSAPALENWLKEAPADWAMLLATRFALRVLPMICDAEDGWLRKYSFLLFQSLIAACTAAESLEMDVEVGALRASSIYGSARSRAKSESDARYRSAGDVRADAAARCAHASVMAVLSKDSLVRGFTFDGARAAVRAAERQDLADDLWKATQDDCTWLTEHLGTDDAGRLVTSKALWSRSASKLWRNNWLRLGSRLFAIDPSFNVWIEWYDRRLLGEEAAFRIPGDTHRIEDKEILRRLADAPEVEFWGKGHEYVNATLKSWLREARKRVHPRQVHALSAQDITTRPPEIGSPTLTSVSPRPPLQNRNALSFRTDEEGRIAIDDTAQVDQLRRDTAARERHAEVVRLARRWLEACRGSNAGVRLVRFIEDYLVSLGDGIEAAKPSLLVLRGERIRQEIARYETADSMLAPITDEILLDGKGMVAGHNVLVALDPVLNSIDTAVLGPDRQPVLIAPEDFRQKVYEADEMGILAEGVMEVIDGVALLAPAVPDPANRLSVSFGEMAQNLIIEAFACALNHPVTSAVVIGAAGTMTSGMAAGAIGSISIMGSIKMAEYLVTYRHWFMDRLGNTPTWQTLFERLADWLEEITPFKPK